MTRNDWVLNAIKAILKVQELRAQVKTEIRAIWQQQLAKFEELLAALAEQQKLGDIAKLAARDRAKLEAMADAQLEKWRLRELRYAASNPKNKLERLCKEYQDLTEEARCIRDEETNRQNIERMERLHFPAGWNEEEFSDDWDEQFPDEEQFPDVIE
jgi:hypothetical protein